jgi:hypothetical protein
MVLVFGEWRAHDGQASEYYNEIGSTTYVTASRLSWISDASKRKTLFGQAHGGEFLILGVGAHFAARSKMFLTCDLGILRQLFELDKSRAYHGKQRTYFLV